MSHKKFGPDRFSSFDVFWQTDRQTNKQTPKQTDKPNLYIEEWDICHFLNGIFSFLPLNEILKRLRSKIIFFDFGIKQQPKVLNNTNLELIKTVSFITKISNLSKIKYFFEFFLPLWKYLFRKVFILKEKKEKRCKSV